MEKIAVVLHIDMDAFYCQVERSVNPALKDVPLVVIQYNPYGSLVTLRPQDNRINLLDAQNGSIIAVSYEARKAGRRKGIGGPSAHTGRVVHPSTP